MRPYLSGEHPIRFAHRGGAALWPENTMAAFQGSYDLGIRYMETDVHLTADGVVVVFHDHELDHLTDGVGKVVDWTWADLQHLDAGYSFGPERDFPHRGTGLRIPRLDEAMAAFPDVRWNVDMKHTPVVDVLAYQVIEASAEERVMAASFYDHRLRRFRKATDKRVATSAGPAEITKLMLTARVRRRAKVAADALQVPTRLATPALIEAAHDADLAVHVWTVDDEVEMTSLLDIGVDGIMSDRPDLLVEVVGENGAHG